MSLFSSMKSSKQTDLQPLGTLNGDFLTHPTRKFLQREKWERPNPNEVRSFIPGMVVHLAAEEGQTLAAGTPLLTFEAMKMENTLTMPCEGVVRKFHVKVGDVFPKNIILVEIEGTSEERTTTNEAADA